MTNRTHSIKGKRQRAGTLSQSRGVWVCLPARVVEARAGVIPSGENDGCPPPVWLSARELSAWHSGLPVFVSNLTIVRRLKRDQH
jgi:hypothetical protein